MNDLFIGDSDFIEVSQRAKTQQELRKQTDLLAQSNAIEQARLNEFRRQTELLKDEANKQQFDRDDQEERRRHLKAARKGLIEIKAFLESIISISSPADVNFKDNEYIQLYTLLIDAQEKLAHLEFLDLFESLEDMQVLLQTKALLDRLLDQNYTSLIALIDRTIASLAGLEGILRGAADKLINSITLVTGRISDDKSFLEAKTQYSQLYEAYEKVVSENWNPNSGDFLHLFQTSRDTINKLPGTDSVNLDVVGTLANSQLVYREAMAATFGNIDILSCSFEDIECRDRAILDCIMSNINARTYVGIHAAKSQLPHIIVNYGNLQELVNIIAGCETAIQYGSEYQDNIRDELSTCASRILELIQIINMIRRKQTCADINAIYSRVCDLHSEIEESYNMEICEALVAGRYIGSKFRFGLIKMIESINLGVARINRSFVFPSKQELSMALSYALNPKDILSIGHSRARTPLPDSVLANYRSGPSLTVDAIVSNIQSRPN